MSGVNMTVAELSDLRADLDDINDHVWEIQWSDYGVCYVCNQHKDTGHSPDCRIQKIFDTVGVMIPKFKKGGAA